MVRSLFLTIALIVAAPSAFAFGGDAEANARSQSNAHAHAGANANANARQHQEQAQGQLQGQAQKSVNVNTNVAKGGNAHATGGDAYSGSISKSGVYGSGNSHNYNSTSDYTNSQQKTVVEGDSTYVEGDDFDFPAASAATTFATSCSQGMSAQGVAGGGSISTSNPVCDWLAIADATKHAPNSEMYQAALTNAYAAAMKRDNTSKASMILVKLRGIITFGIL